MDYPVGSVRPLSTVHTYSLESIGQNIVNFNTSGDMAGLGGQFWPLANLAMYIPFCLSVTITIAKLWLYVGVAANNWDIGIYDEAGTRLVSSGSTAAASTGIEVADVTDTVVGPGLFYFGQAWNGTAGGPHGLVLTGLVYAQRSIGIVEQTSAFPLPATATFAAFARTIIPFMGLSRIVAI